MSMRTDPALIATNTRAHCVFLNLKMGGKKSTKLFTPLLFKKPRKMPLKSRRGRERKQPAGWMMVWLMSCLTRYAFVAVLVRPSVVDAG